MLSFKALSEKKTKVKINPKMADVMEGGAPITMHPYSKGGKVKKSVKENHGEDCDCMKCESKRRRDDVNDGPDVQTEAKVAKLRQDLESVKQREKTLEKEKVFWKMQLPFPILALLQ